MLVLKNEHVTLVQALHGQHGEKVSTGHIRKTTAMWDWLDLEQRRTKFFTAKAVGRSSLETRLIAFVFFPEQGFSPVVTREGETGDEDDMRRHYTRDHCSSRVSRC